MLKTSGRFGVYDVMKMTADKLPYPMPWAETSETSFVEPPDIYRKLLSEAGFEIESEANRREFGLKLWREMQENIAKHGPPPLSLRELMGPTAKERFANVTAMLERGVVPAWRVRGSWRT